jgi:NADP-dependent 3-hydroxy acid dehydrogenase YdfG
MKIEFKGQVGIITGAASGLGRAIALNLSEKGVKLALFDRDTNGLQNNTQFINIMIKLIAKNKISQT